MTKLGGGGRMAYTLKCLSDYVLNRNIRPFIYKRFEKEPVVILRKVVEITPY